MQPSSPPNAPGDTTFSRRLAFLTHNIYAFESVCADYEHLLNKLHRREAAVASEHTRTRNREVKKHVDEIDRILALAKRVRVSPTKQKPLDSRSQERRKPKRISHHNPNPNLNPAVGLDRNVIDVPNDVANARLRLGEQEKRTNQAKASLLLKIDEFLAHLASKTGNNVRQAEEVMDHFEGEVDQARLVMYNRYLQQQRQDVLQKFKRMSTDGNFGKLRLEEKLPRLFPLWFKIKYIAEEEKLLSYAYYRARSVEEARTAPKFAFKPLLEGWTKDIEGLTKTLWVEPKTLSSSLNQANELIEKLRETTHLICLQDYEGSWNSTGVEGVNRWERRSIVRLRKVLCRILGELKRKTDGSFG